ncbi:MAG: hypothetical protein AUI93_03470 [Crenarchaeota archaeon 13_1_40CM_3_52_10]|nr:MAG: hypothetical protein AUI93_03470 [Crenarchaeota archaeon 13_1_40CM_3_52_10]
MRFGLGRRTRAGLGLTLGVLIGLGLVILPGVLAPSTQTATTSGSNPRVTTSSTQSYQPGTMNKQPTGATSEITLSSLLMLVGLVLLPAIALSYFARAWTLKQAKTKLRD